VKIVKLGVDFGTNRIVVAAADRGNYPLVSFEAPDGTSPDWFPSLAALRGDERLYGWDAYDQQGNESWTVIRSVKRLLEDAGPQTLLDLGDEQQLKLAGLLDGLTSALLATLRQRFMVEPELQTVPTEEFSLQIDTACTERTDPPRLLKSYLSVGAKICGPPALDREFGTIDFLTLVDTEQLTSAARSRFFAC